MTQKAEPVTSTFSGRHHTKMIFKHLLPKAIIGLILILVVIGAVVAIDKHREDEPKTGVCSTALIKQSFANLVLHNNNGLAGNVQTIQRLSDYQQDPNCMYIVTEYYVREFNSSKAQNSLALFNKAYVSSNINPLLSEYASPDTLRLLVNSMNTSDQQEIKNSELLSTPASKTRP